MEVNQRNLAFKQSLPKCAGVLDGKHRGVSIDEHSDSVSLITRSFLLVLGKYSPSCLSCLVSFGIYGKENDSD